MEANHAQIPSLTDHNPVIDHPNSVKKRPGEELRVSTSNVLAIVACDDHTRTAEGHFTPIFLAHFCAVQVSGIPGNNVGVLNDLSKLHGLQNSIPRCLGH